ncbi:MAG: hypothetical protein LBR44_02525 [Clostridiales Family XIII bacterium]|jgi:hypothetical protein|nr:hypothetical protein [Clostridiales Family XIII bacterium]
MELRFSAKDNRLILSRLAARGQLVRLMRGVYCDADAFEALDACGKYTLTAQAIMESYPHLRPFGVTAAALLGAIPVTVPEKYHFSDDRRSGRAGRSKFMQTKHAFIQIHSMSAGLAPRAPVARNTQGGAKGLSRGNAATLRPDRKTVLATILEVASSMDIPEGVAVINQLLRLFAEASRSGIATSSASLAGGSARCMPGRRVVEKALASTGAQHTCIALNAYRKYGFRYQKTDALITEALGLVCATRGMRHRARAVKALLLATDLADSVAESMLYAKICLLGFAAPLIQINLYAKPKAGGDRQFLARPDGLWALADGATAGVRYFEETGELRPGTDLASARLSANIISDRGMILTPDVARQLLLLEFDGRFKYFELAEGRGTGTGDAVYRSHVRQDRVTNLGARFVRLRWEDLMDDEAVKGILLAAGAPRINV